MTLGVWIFTSFRWLKLVHIHAVHVTFALEHDMLFGRAMRWIGPMGARFAAAGLLTTPACIFCDASEDANRAYLAGREGRNSLSKSSTPPTITKNPAIYRYLVDHSLQTTPD